MTPTIVWTNTHTLARGLRDELLIYLDVPGVALTGETPPRVSIRVDAGQDGERLLGDAGPLQWTADRRLPNPSALRTQAERIVLATLDQLRKQFGPAQPKPPSRKRWDRQIEALADCRLRREMGAPAQSDGGRRTPRTGHSDRGCKKW